MKRVDIFFNEQTKRENKELFNFLSAKLNTKKIEQFIGNLDNNGKPHGFCEICIISDVSENDYNYLEANFNHGVFQGKAEYEVYDKEAYKFIYTTFNFFDDNYGEILFSDNNKYIGAISNLKANGEGLLIFPDKSKAHAYFVNNKYNGIVEFMDENNSIIKRSVYKNGKFLITSDSDAVLNRALKHYNVAPLLLENKDEKSNIFKVKKIVKNIENSIVGQKEAINQITNNILLALLCEKNNNKPLSTMLFTGPTGVGKTETAKQISNFVFNSKPYTVDFANFHDDFMLSSLIGSPAGYIGSDKEPEFLKYIRENENKGGVILFEEIDKADPDCLNIFMRMLDEGEIISASNITYSVKNFIILATTNMTANYTKKLGFSNENGNVKDSIAKTQTGMKKEQVARFDLIVEFNNLTFEERKILTKNAIKEVTDFINTIPGYKIKINYKENFIEDIVNNTNISFGVREIKSQASKAVTQKLAKFIKTNEETNIKITFNSLNDVTIKPIKIKQKNLSEKVN